MQYDESLFFPFIMVNDDLAPDSHTPSIPRETHPSIHLSTRSYVNIIMNDIIMNPGRSHVDNNQEQPLTTLWGSESGRRAQPDK